jgi:hypothetical protein
MWHIRKLKGGSGAGRCEATTLGRRRPVRGEIDGQHYGKFGEQRHGEMHG